MVERFVKEFFQHFSIFTVFLAFSLVLNASTLKKMNIMPNDFLADATYSDKMLQFMFHIL